MNHRYTMLDHVSDLLDPDDCPSAEDEEVRDATTQEPLPDGLVEALMDIGGVYRPGFMTKFQAD